MYKNYDALKGLQVKDFFTWKAKVTCLAN
jgi:hypothetical protein